MNSIELKDLTSEYMDDVDKTELIHQLVCTIKERDNCLTEAERLRKLEGTCLNILSEFAPWDHWTKDGKILSALLEAIDKIQDSREGRDP